MHLRSLALLLFVFGSERSIRWLSWNEVWRGDAPARSPVPRTGARTRAVQSAKPVAAPSHSAGANPSASKPAASTAPATDSTQTPALASPPAFERNNSQDTNRPAGNARRAAGSNAADGVAISGSTTGRAPNCNTQACSNAYRSFDAADCTYQPANGPRRACRK